MNATVLIEIMTESAVNNLFNAAKKVPADKLDWKPLDTGRSVLDQLQECAMSANWSMMLLRDRAFPDLTTEMMAEYESTRKQWTTIEQCEAACREVTAKLIDAIREFPEADLGIKINVPFGPTHDWSIYDAMGLHAWNCTYHLGQINYIQTLYGDKSMG